MPCVRNGIIVLFFVVEYCGQFFRSPIASLQHANVCLECPGCLRYVPKVSGMPTYRVSNVSKVPEVF